MFSQLFMKSFYFGLEKTDFRGSEFSKKLKITQIKNSEHLKL